MALSITPMRFSLALIALLLLPGCALFPGKAVVKTAQVGEIRMAYYTRGSGSPLLMINGYLSTMSLWDPALLERLEKKHTLILFDNRGVGFSTDTACNNTTIPQMADDAAGLVRQLGYRKVDILAWSMGARIGQQLLIRHPELIGKAILCSADPGGSHACPAAPDVESKLNDPHIPAFQKLGLVFPDTTEGTMAAIECVTRIKKAALTGSRPNDFTVSRETTERQNRARTTLWRASNANYEALGKITNPVLVADGRDDLVDPPRNTAIIANRIPFAWSAFLEGGHTFLFQSYGRFAKLVNAFLE